MSIGHHNAFGRVVHHGCSQAQALFFLTLLGFVRNDAGKAHRLAQRIQMAGATRFKPAVLAIKAQHTGSHYKRAAGLQSQAGFFAHHLAVFRMNAGPEPKVTCEISALVAHHAGYALRESVAQVLQIPVPHAAATAIQCQAQLLFTFDQIVACSHAALLCAHGLVHQPCGIAAGDQYEYVILRLLQQDIKRAVFHQLRQDGITRAKPQQSCCQIQHQGTPRRQMRHRALVLHVFPQIPLNPGHAATIAVL